MHLIIANNSPGGRNKQKKLSAMLKAKLFMGDESKFIRQDTKFALLNEVRRVDL